MPPPSSILSNVDPMTLLRDAVAGRRTLTRAEQQRVAVAIGGKNPSLRAYLTVVMMDERAAHDGQPRLSADAVRAIAEDTASYARALAEVAEGRAVAERAAADAVSCLPVALDALEVAPAPDPVTTVVVPPTNAPAWRPEDLEVGIVQMPPTPRDTAFMSGRETFYAPPTFIYPPRSTP